MHHSEAISPHTVRSSILARALLDRDLDAFVVDRDPAPPARGFDDDGPRWRRARRLKRP